MRIAITGATGMIGRSLTDFLSAQGHLLTAITRQDSKHQSQKAVINWDPALNYIEIEELEGFEVIIHLAGANVGEYWSAKHKKNILDSRVQSTTLLCESLSELASKPKLLICASAIGIYGNHPPEEVLDENSPIDTGFLADVCRQWEEAALPAQQAGIRVVHMRLGVVLSRAGGALNKMWRPFQLGLGGRLGDGQQMLSWVALEEIPLVVKFIMENKFVKGPVNVVSPQPVNNAEFTKILGEVFHKPTVLTVPSFAVRLMFGEMGQNLLLEGAHVVPRRLQESGYRFYFSDLREVLKNEIE